MTTSEISETKTSADNLTALSAGELAKLIAAGQISATEVTEAHIRRIEAVNPRLNAVVVPLFEQARAAAKKADQSRWQGETFGPLHGVPITVKECFDVAGTPSTAGLMARTTHSASDDDLLVARLRQAGAIILGKTNVPQLFLYFECDNPVYGRTNNPWNLDRSPGGSSGGEAAIIAAGGSPFGLGNDLGGSVRIPAHFCGIHAFKPTGGRLPMAGRVCDWLMAGQEALTTSAGPMARQVADLHLALKVLTAPGLESHAPAVPPVPLGDPAEVSLKGLRVGMYTDLPFFPTSPALRRAAKEAALALQNRGAIIEEFAPPDAAEALNMFFGLLSADGAHYVQSIMGKGKRDYRIASLLMLTGMPNLSRSVLTAGMRLFGQKRQGELFASLHIHSAAGFWRLVAELRAYRQRFLARLEVGNFDALICPPCSLPALTHGSSFYLTTAGVYGMVYNLLGLPAGVVSITRVRPDEEGQRPLSLDVTDWVSRQVEKGSAGLPVGVQVVARPWRDEVALALMMALEEDFKTRPDYPATQLTQATI